MLNNRYTNCVDELEQSIQEAVANLESVQIPPKSNRTSSSSNATEVENIQENDTESASVSSVHVTAQETAVNQQSTRSTFFPINPGFFTRKPSDNTTPEGELQSGSDSELNAGNIFG